MSASDKELPVCTVSKVEDADSRNQPKAKRGKKGERTRWFIKGYCKLFGCGSICNTNSLEGPGQQLFQ